MYSKNHCYIHIGYVIRILLINFEELNRVDVVFNIFKYGPVWKQDGSFGSEVRSGILRINIMGKGEILLNMF